MIGIKQARCSNRCGQMLFRIVAPYTIEVKCPRCKDIMLMQFDPATGYPITEEVEKNTFQSEVVAS